MRMLLMVVVLGAFGLSSGAADVAFAAGGGTSATPPVPTSKITGPPGATVTYCVSNYAPNSDVTVTNKLTGDTRTIHTDSTGAGCTQIPVRRACKGTTTQTIVATGIDQAGKPASSQVVYNAPPDPKLCKPSPTPTPTPSPTPKKCKSQNQAQLSVYVVKQGARVRGHACGFNPFETVFVYLHSTPVFVGSTTADGSGTAADRVHIPTCIQPGQHEIEFVGQSSGHVATATFTVKRAPGCRNRSVASGGGSVGSGGGSVTPVSANSGGATGSGGGSLAFTGADILAMVLAGLVLLALGVVAMRVRRRRAA
jgi:hypothetical protein